MTKQETLEYLAARDVAFETEEHPAVFNMEELKAVDLKYPDRDAKNLFVRDDKKTGWYLITVMGDKRVDLKAFRQKFGLRKLSFASPEDLMSVMGLIPGAVTPLGLLSDAERKVEWYLDASFGDGLMGVHPNDNKATVWLKAADLKRLIEDHGNTVHIVDI
ncbi:MAG: prolyl-tRNA synthetase associated domain-containing protein [Clostridia bacterium]|nr:prolyl-tRNA synthetase associated domain-containing protein [Clostridia bacterium]